MTDRLDVCALCGARRYEHAEDGGLQPHVFQSGWPKHTRVEAQDFTSSVPEADLPRRFVLWRVTDRSGVSGTGPVAYGVQFADGKVVTRWDSTMRGAAQTAVWDSLEDMLAIHGHGTDTQVAWVD